MAAKEARPIWTRFCRTRLALLIFLGCIGAAAPAQEAGQQLQNGNDLLALCESDVTWHVTVCVGFVIGVSQTLNSLNASSTQRDVCLPPRSSNGQIKDVMAPARFAAIEHGDYVSRPELEALALAWGATPEAIIASMPDPSIVVD